MPVRHNILPRPKMRDYNKEDQEGLDLTYRTSDLHTVQPGRIMPDTMRPVPFSPALHDKEQDRSRYAHTYYEDPMKRFRKSRRLSKTKRQSW